MNQLKPCPFCGSEYVQVRYMGGKWQEPSAFDSGYRGECCECGVITAACATEAEAIATWNTRTERTCKSTTDDNAWCFVCSECGKSFPRSNLHLAHNHGEINYCPNCGAKVVGE